MRIPRQESKVASLSTLPMVNIAFLLLIFFMLAGTIEPPSALTIDPPESVADGDPDEGAVIVGINLDGKVSLDGIAVSLTKLRETLAARTPTPTVAVRADATLNASRLVHVLVQIREAGIRDVHLHTIPPR